MNHTPSSLRACVVFAGLLVTGTVPAQAQTAPQNQPSRSAAPDQGKDETIVLSEFRVDASKDRGYVATNATTGTRLNMSLKEIPMPIEVITREFMDDIGAVDIKESLQYSAGVVQDFVEAGNSFTFSPSGTGQNTGILSRDSAAVNIRGYNTRSFLRSGFRQDTVTDVVNVDRMEVARGPQALLYGVAALGGIVNITPRYPRPTPSTVTRFSFGNERFVRGDVYNTGPVYKSADRSRYINYGVGLVYQESGAPEEYDLRRRKLITPAVEIHPFANTNIFIDVEYGRFSDSGNGPKDTTLADVSAGSLRNQYGLLAAENVNVYNETLQVGRDRYGLDRFHRISGPDPYSDDNYFSGTIEVTQKLLRNLTLVASANMSDRDTERLGIDSFGVASANTAGSSILPSGSSPGVWTYVGPNPVNPAQAYWKSISYQWNRTHTHKYIWQTRVDLNYTFRIFGQKQDLLIGRQDQTLRQSELSTAQVTSNIANSTNRSFQAFDPHARVHYMGEQVRPFRDQAFWEWNWGNYAVYQGKWWRDRITTIGGLRWDNYMVRTLNWTYGKSDPTQPDSVVENWIRPAGYDDVSFDANGKAVYNNPGANNGSAANPTTKNDTPRKNGYRFGNEIQRERSPTVGLSAAITQDLSIYVTSATGIFPNTGQRNGRGDPFEAERTKSKEVGLKFDLLNDKRGRARVSGTVAYFKVARDNAIYNLFWAPQPRSNNQTTLRSGFTGSVLRSGTGPNAYSVMNSGYTSFQTDKPVTYLLPMQYVAAADLSSARVTGAPQGNGYILVDYASLGSAATDPLRRAMDAAAQDTLNLTALQAGSNNVSGAAGLYANNAYALNRNSDTAYSDETKGVDGQIYINWTDNWSTVLTYTHLVQGVTGGFRVADQPNGTEYDSWWNYMGVPLESRRGDKDESAVSFEGQVKGARTIDNPRNQISLWTKYEFTETFLKGLDAGLGVVYNGPRLSELAINNGARDLHNSENVRFKPMYPKDYRLNLGLGYTRKFGARKWNFRLNVNNLLDVQKRTAYGESTLYIDPTTGKTVASTTAGAQKIVVPERASLYFDPISFRFTVSTKF